LTEHGFTPSGEAHIAGQDNDAVLGEILGLSKADIRDLVDRQVVQ
jgi:hypothetical protein